MMTAMEYETITADTATTAYPCLTGEVDKWTRDYGEGGFKVQRSVEMDGAHRRVKLITSDRTFALTAFVNVGSGKVDLWV